MKKIIGLVTVLAALALGMNAVAGSFGANNIVIYRVGDGSTEALTNTGNSVWLDEYTTNALWAYAGSNCACAPPTVQSIRMPTNWVGAQAPLLADGAAFGEGAMTRSVDGRFLVVPGFGATFGQFTNASIGGSSTTNAAGQTNVARVVGLVDGFGRIYTTTAQTNANEAYDDIRAAVSTDGTNIWLAGAANGGKYTTRGSMLSTQVEETARNVRSLDIFTFGSSTTLYFSAAGRVGSATNPAGLLPTTFIAGNFTNLPGVLANGQGSTWNFAAFNLANQNNGGAAPDTLYVADNTTNAPGEPLNKAGAVLKYCYVGGTWVLEGFIPAIGATGLTGMQDGTNVYLYITEGGTASPNAKNVMLPYHDLTGYGNDPSSINCCDGANPNHEPLTPPLLSGTLINTRGVAIAPQGGDSGSLTGAGAISVGPPFAPNFSGPAGGPFTPSNFVYSVGNLGANDTNFVVVGAGNVPWLTISPTAGTVVSGSSTTVTLTPNATANTQVGGFTYSGTFNVRTGSPVGLPTSALTPTLTVFALFVTPSSNFVVTGSPGGPFIAPISTVYTVSNATLTAISWNAYTSTNWNSLSTSAQLNSITDSLPGGQKTNLTVAINTNTANSLAIGVYEDQLVVSNLNAGAELTRRYIDLQVGAGFFDDFSQYTQNADVVGQRNWFADTPANTTYALFVSNNVVTQPGGCNPPDSTSETPVKNFSQSNITNTTAIHPWIYAGMLITVTYAPPTTAVPINYTLSFYQAFGNGYATGNMSMTDNGSGKFTFNCQVNAGAHITIFGNPARNYNQQYEVYEVVDAGDSNAFVFVNDVGGGWDTNNIFNNTPDAWDQPASFPAGYDPGMGSFHIGNYCAGTPQEGFKIAKLAVSTNYPAVYQFLHAAACSPPTAGFTPSSASGAAPLPVNFIDTSVANSGTLTTWVWTFSDGGTSGVPSPSHTFTLPGTYTASLTVTNSCGDGSASPATGTINVYDPYAWWRLYYYNATNTANGAGNADPNGTGMNNTNKFLAGFATNAAAYLHVISIAKTNTTDINVTYLGAAGDTNAAPGFSSRTNVLEFTTGTANGSYATNNFASTYQTNILSSPNGLGVVTNMVDPGGANSPTSRYYRVRVLVP